MLLNRKRTPRLSFGQFSPFRLLLFAIGDQRRPIGASMKVFGNLKRENGNRQLARIINEKNCEARKTLKPFYEELYGRKPEVSI